mmetsp:Transcript_49652/g.151163  ORF Transcript_49652/g.151163 Transcript_49652/m.151163 type:complete len:224 (-) Transcript_49652:566-1237(-)
MPGLMARGRHVLSEVRPQFVGGESQHQLCRSLDRVVRAALLCSLEGDDRWGQGAALQSREAHAGVAHGGRVIEAERADLTEEGAAHVAGNARHAPANPKATLRPDAPELLLRVGLAPPGPPPPAGHEGQRRGAPAPPDRYGHLARVLLAIAEHGPEAMTHGMAAGAAAGECVLKLILATEAVCIVPRRGFRGVLVRGRPVVDEDAVQVDGHHVVRLQHLLHRP